MTRKPIIANKAMLKAKEGELIKALRHRDGITIEKTADTLDEVLLAGERELAIRNLDRDAQLLRSVRFALARIDDGSYGICLHCEEAISPRRLNALPWAAYCLACQDAIDRRELQPDGYLFVLPKVA
ncbi:MAG: TraR/DksA family transcriptional regulator [Bryobacterales bacterium]|nr:TraR/DksA family transcriptional regulator [Bryobacterales bacterium]